jgi:hypothetical protein
MRKFLESLSLTSGAILIALLSLAVVWFLYSVGPTVLRKIWVLVVPFVLAYSLYWSPVWFGADDAAGYDVWKFVIVLWFLAGLIPSSALVAILESRAAKLRPKAH